MVWWCGLWSLDGIIQFQVAQMLLCSYGGQILNIDSKSGSNWSEEQKPGSSDMYNVLCLNLWSTISQLLSGKRPLKIWILAFLPWEHLLYTKFVFHIICVTYKRYQKINKLLDFKVWWLITWPNSNLTWKLFTFWNSDPQAAVLFPPCILPSHKRHDRILSLHEIRIWLSKIIKMLKWICTDIVVVMGIKLLFWLLMGTKNPHGIACSCWTKTKRNWQQN